MTDRTISVIDSNTDTVIKVIPSGAGTSANFGTVSAVYRRYYLPNFTDGTLTIVNTDTDTVTNTVGVDNSGTMACTKAPMRWISERPHHVEMGSPVVPLVSW